MNEFVASETASGHEHDEDAVIGHEQKAYVFDHAAGQRRRNKDSQTARNSGEHVACTLHHGFGRLRRSEFAANPLAVFGAGGGLRRDLLDEEAICRSRGHAPGGSVRLVQIAFAFEVGHHIANRGGAQRLDVPVRNATRGNGLARFDIVAHNIRQNLLMALLLQNCRAHGFL